jgi:sugar (glycoside-pentoside-hexuronide) transporter
MTEKIERRDYGLYFMGQNIVYLFIMNYIQNYFTDVVGIAAGTVAIILLVARFWDAVNDPIFGVIVDRSRLKSGRYKPWLKLSTYILPFFTIAIFCAPVAWPQDVKTVFCGLLYIVWGMAYTICDVPIYSLSVAMTNDIQERTALIARGRLHSVMGIFIVMTLTVPLTNILGGLFGSAAPAWLLAAILFSALGFILMRPIHKSAQERFIDQESDPITLGAILQYSRSNKYLLIFFGAVIVASLTNTTTILPLYFASVNLGDSNMYVPVVVVTMIGSPLVSIFMPRLTKRFDKFQIYMTGLFTTIVTSVAAYFIGYEGWRFVPFLIVSAVKGLGFSCSTVMSYMFTADCIEYGTYVSGKRAEGVTFSIQTFTTKMTGAISGFVAMGLLGWLFDYRSAYYVDSTLVMPDQPLSAMRGIWFMYSLFPAFGACAAFLILIFLYKLRDKDVQVMADVNSGRINREQGAKLLGGKYEPVEKG